MLEMAGRLFSSFGVTGITRLTIKGITGHIMMLDIHLRLGMGMTIQAGKISIVGCNMTVKAVVLRMSSRFYGKGMIKYSLRPENMR